MLHSGRYTHDASKGYELTAFSAGGGVLGVNLYNLHCLVHAVFHVFVAGTYLSRFSPKAMHLLTTLKRKGL